MSDLNAALRAVLDEALREMVRELIEPYLASQPVPADRYLSVPDAAKLLGVSDGTVRSWIRQGKLRRYGCGRVLRVRLSELHDVMFCGSNETPDSDEAMIRDAVRRIKR